MVTAAARPHVFWLGEGSAASARVRAWPIGPALLHTLCEANPKVLEELAHERAELRRHGYPEDLPQPALWWAPSAA